MIYPEFKMKNKWIRLTVILKVSPEMVILPSIYYEKRKQITPAGNWNFDQ
jgi:hypothetical protein